MNSHVSINFYLVTCMGQRMEKDRTYDESSRTFKELGFIYERSNPQIGGLISPFLMLRCSIKQVIDEEDRTPLIFITIDATEDNKNKEYLRFCIDVN